MITLTPMHRKVPNGYQPYIHEQQTPLIIKHHMSRVTFVHSGDAQWYATKMVHDANDTGTMPLPESS